MENVLRGPSHDRVVVCYVATWAVYRPEKGQFGLDDLDPSLCTHMVYSFAGLNSSSNTIKSLDPWQDLKDDYGKGGFEKMTNMKVRYPHLKVTLAIGGWNEGSINYSKMAEDPVQRQIFVTSAVAFLRKYNFDGLDLDWEYPSKRGGSPKDKENFVSLVKELKTELSKHNMILTAALGASKETIDVSYDVVQLSKYLDLIHMMCYDYHGSWDGVVGSNAPLYGENEADTLSVAFTIDYMLKLGAPPEKLVMGLPLYGRTFLKQPALDDVSPSEVPQMGITKVQPAGFKGPYTKEAGFVGYNEICVELNNATSGWVQAWDDRSKTPYAYNGDKMITYDNQRSIAEKVRFAVSRKLRGVMVWSIDTDEFRGDCTPEPDTFVDFYNSLKELRRNPYFKEVLPELDMNTVHDPADKLMPKHDNFAYKVQDGDLTIVIHPRSNTNFPLMRTVEQAVNIAQQEELLKQRLEQKIKQKERENEIGHHDHSTKASKAASTSYAIISIILSLFATSLL
ncbi:putative chitinase 2 isoform X2 [Arctopsyche grandis]|uniref:putative chitinase 2 isoform X2 n=1 Tax=Arctopsyche grandis TaxID=121162 RepID=UPI00406D771F